MLQNNYLDYSFNIIKDIKMKTIIYILLFSLGVSGTYAQNPDEFYVKPEDKSAISGNRFLQKENSNYDKRPFSENKKLTVSLQTGAGVSFSGAGNTFNTWIAPEVNYKLTQKLKISVGTIAMNSNYYNLQNYINAEGKISNNERITQYFLYAKGEYRISDRVNLRGSTMREFSNVKFNSNPFSLNHIGIDIKLSERASISADFQISKGQLPYSALCHNAYGCNSFGTYGSAHFSPFNSFFGTGW